MTEITGLPAATSLLGTDLFVAYVPGEASNKTRKITKAQALADYVQDGTDATLATVDADELNAPLGAIDALVVATSLTIGAEIEKVLTGTGNINIPSINTVSEGSATFTLAGAVVGDQVLIQLPASFPNGLIMSRAVVSGADTITAYFDNVGSGTITGATYSIRATVIRFG